MSWRDELLDASFRGAKFLVDRHSTGGARRVAVHEFPGQDLPETEDLGERAITFDLDAYVLGADYFTQRDALLLAIRRSGPGELVHPYLGTFQVVVIDWRLDESTRDGGRADFSLRFLRVQDVETPYIEADTQRELQDAAQAAQTAAATPFAESWVARASRNALASRRDALAAIDQAFAPLEELIGAATDWRDTLAVLVSQPAAIYARLAADFGRVAALADFQPFWTYYDDSSPSSRALSESVQVASGIAACAWSAGYTAPSYDEAVSIRDQLLDQLDRLALAADDTLYPALRELRTATAADIEARSANLARITTFTPCEVLPALVIAHRLYGPANVEARSADLVARNRLPHPGFVPVRPLEVLSD